VYVFPKTFIISIRNDYFIKNKFISLILVFSLIISMCACGTNDLSEQGNNTGTTVFTDDCGREVVISNEISRIVPSGPAAQIILYAIAPEMLVGLAAQWSDNAKEIIPEQYLDLPYFGQLYNSANLNVEELAMANPQVIIDIGKPMTGGAEDLDTLQTQTNIPTVYISMSLETMPETFRKLGTLLHKEERGEVLAQFCEQVYSRTVTIMDKVGNNKTDALFILGEDGLNVLANGSYHSEVVDLITNNIAVVENPVSKGSGNEVTLEQIALWDPEFIMFEQNSVYDRVSELNTWREIDAIKNNNYIEVPEAPHNWMAGPPAVQRYLGLIWLTSELYPEYCTYDVNAEIKEYYSLFYHCELSDEQYEAIMAHAALN